MSNDLNGKLVIGSNLGGKIVINNRRSEFEIIGRILDLSRAGAKKTEILYQGNLSYFQLTNYLSFLVEKNVLEEFRVKNNGNSGKYYKITSKGCDLLEDINKTLAYFR